MSKPYDVSSHPRLVEERQKRKKMLIKRIVLYVFFILTLIFGLAYYSGDSKITISKIEIEGNSVTSTSNITDVIEDSLDGRYFYLFKKSNIFIYPKHQIIKNIQKEFPRIKNVDINTKEFTGLKITVNEREGAYLWCAEEVGDVYNGEDCYFINTDGYIFDKAPFFSGHIYFKFYSPLSDLENPPLGNYSLGTEKIKNILYFSNALEDLDFIPVIIDTHNPDEQIIFLKRNGEKLPKIIFKSDSDLEEILNNLTISLKKEEFKSEVVDNYETLEYIDLRYKNKVVYKHYE